MVYRYNPSDLAPKQTPERIVEKQPYYVTAETNGSQPNNLLLVLVIIAIVAGVALGLSIANTVKKE